MSTKYFKIIDGDDWVDGNALSSLVDYLYSTDDDVVLSGYVMKYPNKDVYINPIIHPKKNKSRFKEKVTYLANDLCHFTIALHSVTYKTEVFLNNDIYVREHIFYDDNEYVVFPVLYIKTFSYIYDPVYYYRLGNPNQSVAFNSLLKHKKDFDYIFMDIINACDKKRSENTDDICNKNLEVFAARHIGFLPELILTDNAKEAKMACKKKWQIIKKYKIIKQNFIKQDLKNRLLIYSCFLSTFIIRNRLLKQYRSNP